MPKLSRVFEQLVVAVVMAGLTSCGGGSGSDSRAPQSSSNTSITASVDPALPAATAEAIAEVNTFVGSGPLGSRVAVLADQIDGVALALDSDGAIRLASVEATGGGNVVLTADGTALSLARFAIGALPSGVTAAEMNNMIKASASYAGLSEAVRLALMAGVSTTTSAAVISGVVSVVGETTIQLRQVSRSSGSGTKAKPLAYVEEPLPYSLLRTAGATVSVHLVGAQSQRVEVKNSMPLDWVLSANGFEVKAPASTLLAVATGAVLPWVGASSVYVPDAGGDAFGLRLLQTPQSRRLNLLRAGSGILKVGMDWLPDATGALAQCSDETLQALFPEGALDELSNGKSPTPVRDYLTGKIWDVTNWPSILDKCLTKPLESPRSAGNFLKGIAKLVGVISITGDVFNGLGVGYQIWLMAKYWSWNETFTVCEAVGPVIRNCADEIKTKGDPLRMVPGATFVPEYTAYGVGNETGLPARLTFASDNITSVTVNPVTGQISAHETGDATITISNESLGLKSTYHAWVRKPTITPKISTIQLHDNINLRLVDDSGNLLITKGANVTWSSEPAVAPNSIFSAIGEENSVTLTGIKVGFTPVFVGGSLGLFDTGKVTVVDAPAIGYWTITAKYDTCVFKWLFGDFYASPCNVVGGWSGANDTFKVYLAESAAAAGFNAVSETQTFSGGFSTRRPRQVVFSNTDNQFTVSYRAAHEGTTSAANGQGGYVNDYASYEEQVPLNFVVSQSADATMSGTFSGVAPYIRYSGPSPNTSPGIEVDHATFTGSWTAVWTSGSIPLPKFIVPGDYCYYLGSENYQSGLDNKKSNIASEGTLAGSGTCLY